MFAASPPLLGRRSAHSLLRENEKIRKAQEVVIAIGIIAPPNSSASIEHSYGPEVGGSVAVRHSGLWFACCAKLWIRTSSPASGCLGVVNLHGKESWGFAGRGV